MNLYRPYKPRIRPVVVVIILYLFSVITEKKVSPPRQFIFPEIILFVKVLSKLNSILSLVPDVFLISATDITDNTVC